MSVFMRGILGEKFKNKTCSLKIWVCSLGKGSTEALPSHDNNLTLHSWRQETRWKRWTSVQPTRQLHNHFKRPYDNRLLISAEWHAADSGMGQVHRCPRPSKGCFEDEQTVKWHHRCDGSKVTEQTDQTSAAQSHWEESCAAYEKTSILCNPQVSACKQAIIPFFTQAHGETQSLLHL